MNCNALPDTIALLNDQSNAVAEYDDSPVQQLLERITVQKDKFIGEFKTGPTVTTNE